MHTLFVHTESTLEMYCRWMNASEAQYIIEGERDALRTQVDMMERKKPLVVAVATQSDRPAATDASTQTEQSSTPIEAAQECLRELSEKIAQAETMNLF